MTWIGKVKIPFPHHGPGIKGGRVLWIVAHTLECDAVAGLAVALGGGYFQDDQVSVHTVVDPSVNSVAGLDTGTQAYHAGATANAYGDATEATGRAAWTRNDWLGNAARNRALDQQAQAMAGHAVANGFAPGEYRWLSVPEIRSKQVRGFGGHIDFSAAFDESDHWDPGPGYPYDIQMTRIRWYAGVADYWGLDPGTRPDGLPPVTGGGGAEPDFDVLRWLSDPEYV